MSSTGSSSRAGKSGGSGTTIALLVLAVAAIGFIGYFAFIKTGRETVPGSAGSAPRLAPQLIKSRPATTPS